MGIYLLISLNWPKYNVQLVKQTHCRIPFHQPKMSAKRIYCKKTNYKVTSSNTWLRGLKNVKSTHYADADMKGKKFFIESKFLDQSVCVPIKHMKIQTLQEVKNVTETQNWHIQLKGEKIIWSAHNPFIEHKMSLGWFKKKSYE